MQDNVKIHCPNCGHYEDECVSSATLKILYHSDGQVDMGRWECRNCGAEDYVRKHDILRSYLNKGFVYLPCDKSHGRHLIQKFIFDDEFLTRTSVLRNLKIFSALILLFLLIPAVLASPDIMLDDAVVAPESLSTYNVSINNVDKGITGFYVEIGYRNNVVEAIYLNEQDLEFVSYEEINETEIDSYLRFGVVHLEEDVINGDVDILQIVFNTTDNYGFYTPIKITDFTYINETYEIDDDISIQNGTITIVDRGDINLDGDVGFYDGLLVLRHITGIRELTPIEQKIGDINEDGSLTTYDAVFIINNIFMGVW